MLTNLRIKNFRGIRDLTLDPLGRVNLIGGKNGVGKTSVLEALWCLSGPDMPQLTVRIDNFRGLPPPTRETVFVDVFNGFDTNKRIEIAGAIKGRLSSERRLRATLQERSSAIARPFGSRDHPESDLERSTQIRAEGELELVLDYLHDDGKHYKSRGWWVEEVVTPGPPGPVTVELTNAGIHEEKMRIPRRADSVFMASPYRENLQSDAQRFGSLQLQGRDSEILSVLRLVEPQLQALIPILINNTTVIHANLGMGRPIAARLLGEGFGRLLSIALAMDIAKNGGMVLIDEIENGLHHTILRDVFLKLSEMATNLDVQIIAATHSAECIDSAFEALAQPNDQEFFTFHRIDRIEGNSKGTYFDNSMLETAIRHDMEVR